MISDARDFFTGELPSSSIFIHDDFDINNYNPFAIGYNPNNTSSYSESIWNVDYNPLLNNVELNQTSSNRRLLTTLENGTNVTQSLQYQDFTDSYQRHIRPRYNGSTTTSALYNVFSTGNTTFGKTSVIDKNTRQFAFFNEIIASGSDLLSMPERSNVYIKYLIDENSNLTELTKRNYDLLSEDQKYNLYQVQNIFKTEETVNIGLFDNQNPSRQQLLDGNKHIFAGGFRFYPVLWNRNGIANLIYNLVKPKQISIGNYVASDFSITSSVIVEYIQSYGVNEGYYIIRFDATHNSGPVPNNITLTLNFTYEVILSGGLQSYTDYVTVPFSVGQTDSSVFFNPGIETYNQAPSVITPMNQIITNITLQIGGGVSVGGTSTYNLFVSSSTDPVPYFKIHVSQSNILIASPELSLYYPGVSSGSGAYISDGFYFAGNDGENPSYGESDYPFSLNPGDLIRLYSTSSSATGFSVLEEYEISNIILPTSTNPSLSLALHRNINLNTIQTFSANNLTGSISKYIISRKIPDETNIVINYQKRLGQTSAGIAKNINLSPDVDAKLADLVSDLKSKIFSTVLIP
jgi:hypothetical protein